MLMTEGFGVLYLVLVVMLVCLVVVVVILVVHFIWVDFLRRQAVLIFMVPWSTVVLWVIAIVVWGWVVP